MEHIRPLILFTLFCYVVIKIVGFLWEEDGVQAFQIGGGAWYLVFNLIPQSIIHFRFLYLNYGMVLHFKEESGQITITKRKKSITFSLNEIQLIQDCMLPPKYDKRRSVLPFDQYHSYVIYLKNGSRYIITSLMVNKLDLPIDFEKKEAKKFPLLILHGNEIGNHMYRILRFEMLRRTSPNI